MLWLLGTALSYDSVCKDESGTVCDYGLEPARERWNHPQESEHYDLLLLALSLSGIPMEINDEMEVPTWTSGEAVDDLFNPDVTSIAPVKIGAGGYHLREVEPAEFAQLPDYSYGLYDWIAGNETCLAFDNTDASTDLDTCHNFTTHTGALNSSHFLPQARNFWEHYHQLALNRAAECAEHYADLQDTPYEHHALACEQEAMAFEAVAQHYLQDAWSSGHMWERWGGPEYDATKFPFGLNSAQVVAMFSGLIHGAKVILEEASPDLLGKWDDPLCGPHSSSRYIDPKTSDKEKGSGDLFVGSHLLTSDFDHQRQPLMGCSVESLLEVYNATGQAHGEPGVASTSGFESRDPWSDDCWNQRATNWAMANAWGVHKGETPNQVAVFSAKPPLNPVGLGMAYRLHASLLMGPLLDLLNFYGNGGEALTALEWTSFTRDISNNTLHVMMEARLRPNKTNLAEGDVLPLLEVRPNASWSVGGGGDVEALPADYLDIGDWGYDGADDRSWQINLGFLDSHAPDRCSSLGTTDLQDYINAVANADAEDRNVACSQCVALIAPHVRIGVDWEDYSQERAPLCEYINPNVAFLYSGDYAPGPNATAAARLCGCAEGMGVITRDSGDDTILFANRSGASLQLRGDYFPTGESPRDAAMGGDGNQLFVTAGEHVAVYVVTEGNEYEVDTDDDLQTETEGAPVGVTRLDVGPPRGIALQHNGRYGLVATAEDIVVIDQWDLEVVATYTKSFLGFHSKEKPYDIAITHDDQRAFVTAYGSYPQLANEVHVLDLSDLPYNLQLETTFITGGDTQNQFLEISPDGQYLAVTCPEIDYVNVYNTSDYALVGNYIEEHFEQAHYPIAVEWSLESDAIYVGYLSGPYDTSLSGNGVVRKCYLDEPKNCEHAVGVDNSVRDLLVTPEGIVWVGDDGGNLTPLAPELFDPGVATSGFNQQTGLYDGTGGCLDGDLRAEPCPSAENVGRAVGALVEF